MPFKSIQEYHKYLRQLQVEHSEQAPSWQCESVTISSADPGLEALEHAITADFYFKDMAHWCKTQMTDPALKKYMLLTPKPEFSTVGGMEERVYDEPVHCDVFLALHECLTQRLLADGWEQQDIDEEAVLLGVTMFSDKASVDFKVSMFYREDKDVIHVCLY
jgi:hypothetical protein